MRKTIEIAPEIVAALSKRQPVVALESTLITHGFEADQGISVAGELESIVRQENAVPATIGVIEGRVTVGLTPKQIETLAHTSDVYKTNLSNLGTHIAKGSFASTTVAATMHVAAQTGIRVFATGGIGGVHRDIEITGDVSADLTALSRYPVAVVCAGAKAILDLGRTLEYLETLGVPVLAYQGRSFPAFYRRETDFQVDACPKNLEELRNAINAHWELGFTSGVVVAQPIPKNDEMPLAIYEKAIHRALEHASEKNIRGRDLTPFLLKQMEEHTHGESVKCNLALLRHNARTAAQLATVLKQNSD